MGGNARRKGGMKVCGKKKGALQGDWSAREGRLDKVRIVQGSIFGALEQAEESADSGRFGEVMGHLGEVMGQEKLQSIIKKYEEKDRRCIGNEWSLDKCMKNNDFHCWVVNEKDEMMFDPYFQEYDGIREFHDCPDKEMFHQEWSLEDQKKAWVILKKRMNKKIKEKKREEGVSTMEFLTEYYIHPKSLSCNYNAAAYKVGNDVCGNGYDDKGNLFKKLRIVVGKMGWKKRDGEIWWEFG